MTKRFSIDLPDDEVRTWKRSRQCRSNFSTNVLGENRPHTLGLAAPLRKPMHPVTRAGAAVQRKTRRTR